MITACLLHPVAWPFRTVHCPAVSSVRSAQHRPLTRSETGSPSDLPAATRSADTAALWSSSLLSPATQQCRGLQAANQPLLQAVRMSWSTSCLKKAEVIAMLSAQVKALLLLCTTTLARFYMVQKQCHFKCWNMYWPHSAQNHFTLMGTKWDITHIYFHFHIITVSETYLACSRWPWQGHS